MRLFSTSDIGRWIAVLAVGALFAQCSDEEYASGTPGKLICFGEPELDAWQSDNDTRGSIITKSKFKDYYSDFRIYAWAAKKDDTAATTYTDTLSYIMGDIVDVSSGHTSEDYYWPGAEYEFYFLAFAPSSLAESPTFNEKKGTISFDYTIPKEVTEQKDILFSLTKKCPGDGSTATAEGTKTISFKHLLTAVQIKLADKELMTGVSSVSLENVYSQGTLTYTILNANEPSWGSLEEKANFTSDYKSGTNLASDEYTFFMMPQKFTGKNANTEARIVLHFEDGSSLSKSLQDIGKDWSQYKKVIYTLSYTKEDIKVLEVPESVDLGAEDTSVSFKVVSEKQKHETKKDDDGKNVTTITHGDKLDWTVESKPDWISETVSTADDGETVTFTTEKQSTFKTGDAAIREQEAVTDKDLSDNLQNTANCYIVNAAGSYKFPLVYGNALKNGMDNKAAYEIEGFCNHLGQPITNPYIYKNEGCEPAKAVLIWQDKKGLITKVDLSEKKDYITFQTADRASIGQGNALVAVCDAEGTILWSWHIWVTFYVPNQASAIGDDWKDKVIIPRVTGTRDIYTIMPINLGWCDNCEYYPGREGSIVIKQTDSGITKTIKVYQRSLIKGTFGSQPFYQWCRKDPFLPADVSEGFDLKENKTFSDIAAFDLDGNNVQFKVNKEDSSMQEAIKYPDEFTGVRDSKLAYITENMPWQYGLKTIYDPSPVGYMVCERAPLTVVSTEDNDLKLGEDTPINTPYTKTEMNEYDRYPEVHTANGWTFYCYPKKDGEVDPSGGTFFIPISLYRDLGTGDIKFNYKDYRGSGSLWAVESDMKPTGNGYCMGFYGNGIRVHAPSSTTNKWYGRAVRCMKE